MKNENVSSVSGLIGLIGSIREKANCFLEQQMKEKGIEGLLPAHGSILKALLVNNGKLRMNELACHTGRSKSTVSELVSKLEKAGYLSKENCYQDRRVNYVSLTPKTMAIEKDFNDISQQLIDTFSHGFSEDELEFLAKLLTRVQNNF
jgi:MarR family transcriptional regulator, organic hydroperoxide resistance regulator